MGDAQVRVRSATKRDVRAAAEVMARAFEHDPPFGWLLPDDASRRRRLRILFRSMIRWEVLPCGDVEVACAPDGAIVGVALWLPPGRWVLPLGRQLLTLPSSLRAMGRRIGAGSALLTAFAREHPTDPHWYLHGIGVDPGAQGRGVGGALLRSRLDRCDAAGEPAYLEASKPANVTLYERFGFAISGRLTLPAGAPEVTPMWRCPARDGETPDRGAGPAAEAPGTDDAAPPVPGAV